MATIGKPAKWGADPALFAHNQADDGKIRKVGATELGELLTANGAKGGVITRNTDDTIDTLVLTYEVDGVDMEKTFDFSYTDGMVSSWSVAVAVA
ncbi:MAG: hypothetical protein U9M89_02815 [Patescibacteria group bacterium]|nr:hypothetical protein [Patescibacteria group bacterium]